MDKEPRVAAPGVTSSAIARVGKVEPKPADDSVFIARAAACVVRLPDDAEPMFTTPEARSLADQVQKEFEDALTADARVTEVLSLPPRLVDNARTDHYWQVRSDVERLTDAFQRYEGLRFNRSSVFRVRVPTKNQPRYRNLDDVPADEYLVEWDGQALVVQWEQDTPRKTGSGGHVVLTLLEDVGTRIGRNVELISCATTCHHRFVHADFVTFSGEHDHEQFEIRGGAGAGPSVETPYGKADSDVENLHRTYRSLSGPLSTYGQAKSLARLIMFLDWRARLDSSSVLAIAYDRASRAPWRHPITRLRDTWQLRGSRSATKELMAGLWLALVTIDSQRGAWRMFDHRLREELGRARMPLLVGEFDIDGEQIEAQDVSLLRDSTSELGARMEGRMLLVATSAGAIAALAGAALAVLLT